MIVYFNNMIETLLAQCAQVIVPEPSEQAIAYYRSGNFLWIVQQFWSLAVPLLLLITAWSGKMGQFAQKWGKKWYLSLIIYLFLFLAFSSLLSLPLDFYTGYLRQHEYGLSNQPLSRWVSNWGKSNLVSFAAMAAFVWIFYLLLKKSPKRWWLYSSFVSIALTFFAVFIQPIWVAPLFNQFGPMKDQVLEQQILTLASKAGIEGARVFEVDKSKDTKAINAYVTGFGASKRIVLWDTAIQSLTPEELLFVMGHEMGHYVLNHIWWGMLFDSTLTFLLFYLTYRTATYLLRRYEKRFQFYHLYDFASLPLLLLVFSFYQLLLSPLSNFQSRKVEHDADRFGLEITQNNQAAAEAFVALQQQNLGMPRPGPLYVFWRGTHPSLGSRVDFANSYCPWTTGEPLQYGSHFKSTQVETPEQN